VPPLIGAALSTLRCRSVAVVVAVQGRPRGYADVSHHDALAVKGQHQQVTGARVGPACGVEAVHVGRRAAGQLLDLALAQPGAGDPLDRVGGLLERPSATRCFRPARRSTWSWNSCRNTARRRSGTTSRTTTTRTGSDEAPLRDQAPVSTSGPDGGPAPEPGAHRRCGTRPAR
jgi:hypothetical protein